MTTINTHDRSDPPVSGGGLDRSEMSTRHRHSDTNASNDNVAATDGRFPDETTPVRHRRFKRSAQPKASATEPRPNPDPGHARGAHAPAGGERMAEGRPAPAARSRAGHRTCPRRPGRARPGRPSGRRHPGARRGPRPARIAARAHRRDPASDGARPGRPRSTLTRLRRRAERRPAGSASVIHSPPARGTSTHRD